MLLYWMWYAMLEGLTPLQKRTLLERFSTPDSIYKTVDYSDVEGITPEMKNALSDKDMTAAEKRIKACSQKGIGIVALGDAAYPGRLRSIADPPLVLYYKGVLPDFSCRPAIGVVGTRKATAYGMSTARGISQQIAQCGGLVVSGGAAGVDTAALQGALAADAATVSVLGCGVDVAYPASNRQLFAQLQENGCLLSEYPPGTRPAPWQFPARNRIISGISNGVLVIEAPQKSGALITARDAMEQGRDIFVVPGNINLPTCIGSNALLREGATAVFSGWDVVKEYAFAYPDTVSEAELQPLPVAEAHAPEITHPDKKAVDIPAVSAYSGKENALTDLTEQERAILACLDSTPRPMDEVIAQLGAQAGNILGVVTKLALKGLVVNHPGRLISAKKQ